MGGIETHCEQLYSELSKEVDEIVVLARSPYVSKAFYFKDNVRVIPVFTIRNKLLETFLHTFLCIIYARIVIKPDVLHIHAIGPGLFAPFAKLLGFKVLVTHHGADYNRKKWNNFAKRLLRFGELLVVKYADRVAIVGASLTAALKIQYPENACKLNFVPNGCPSPLQHTLTAETNVPEDIMVEAGKYILFVGRLVPEKGIHDLINAFTVANLTDTKLLIVGSVDFEDKYSKQLKQNSSDEVIFAGRRTGQDLISIYRGAKLFVLPSYHEGLPIVALEALSMDVPILLSNIPPHMDIGLPSNNYFELGNIEALAKQLNLEPQKIVGKKAILEKYDWSRIAARTKQLLEECNEA